MASQKTLDERIAEAKTKLEQSENHLKQLLNRQKEAERKARTHRLVERGAMLESMIDGAASLTNEEIKAILSAALGGASAHASTWVKPLAQPAGEPGATPGAGV